jgi:hypothetical protein
VELLRLVNATYLTQCPHLHTLTTYFKPQNITRRARIEVEFRDATKIGWSEDQKSCVMVPKIWHLKRNWTLYKYMIFLPVRAIPYTKESHLIRESPCFPFTLLLGEFWLCEMRKVNKIPLVPIQVFQTSCHSIRKLRFIVHPAISVATGQRNPDKHIATYHL